MLFASALRSMKDNALIGIALHGIQSYHSQESVLVAGAVSLRLIDRVSLILNTHEIKRLLDFLMEQTIG